MNKIGRFGKIIAEKEGLDYYICPECGVSLEILENTDNFLATAIPFAKCPECETVFWRSEDNAS